jgi:hypothetical protein
VRGHCDGLVVLLSHAAAVATELRHEWHRPSTSAGCQVSGIGHPRQQLRAHFPDVAITATEQTLARPWFAGNPDRSGCGGREGQPAAQVPAVVHQTVRQRRGSAPALSSRSSTISGALTQRSRSGITVTTSSEHEVGNVPKCLLADFHHVVVLSGVPLSFGRLSLPAWHSRWSSGPECATVRLKSCPPCLKNWTRKR